MSDQSDRQNEPAPTTFRTVITLRDGQFSGHLTGAHLPAGASIELLVDGAVVGQAEPAIEGDGAAFTSAMPAECLSDGVSTVVFRLQPDNAILASYPIRAGANLAGDVVAELAVMRGEFLALKRAFMAEALHESLKAVERPLIVAEAVEAAVRQVSLARDVGPAIDHEPPGATDAGTSADEG
ncbi:MAG: hypothetical protein AAF439_09025 [Pseudomonadota bacterium]